MEKYDPNVRLSRFQIPPESLPAGWPEELWIKDRNIVQEAVTKAIPMKKKCKKAKWLSEDALQIA